MRISLTSWPYIDKIEAHNLFLIKYYTIQQKDFGFLIFANVLGLTWNNKTLSICMERCFTFYEIQSCGGKLNTLES